MLDIVWVLIMSIDYTSRKNMAEAFRRNEGRSLELILAEADVVQ
jgi:hypothetical protein